MVKGRDSSEPRPSNRGEGGRGELVDVHVDVLNMGENGHLDASSPAV